MTAKDGGESRLVALECVRGIAGFYVFLHHFAHIALRKPYPRIAGLFVFGQPAVMIFFIMSGFVIFHSTGEAPTFRDYFVRRFRRIYPLFVISMALEWMSQCVSRGGLVVPGARELVVNLLMLQDGGDKPGVLAGPFMGNSPLWSLSYEWFFYMAFFAVIALFPGRGERHKYVVAGLSLIGFFTYFAFPNPISVFLNYFVLWWTGVELAREYRATGRVSWRGQWFPLASVVVLSALWLMKVKAARAVGITSAYAHPGLECRHFLTTLVILVIGLAWYSIGGKGFSLLLGWGRHLAPISYAIYICHVPVIVLSMALHLTGSPLLDFLWVLPLTLGVSYVLERKLQPLINTWSKRWLPRRSRPATLAAG